MDIEKESISEQESYPDKTVKSVLEWVEEIVFAVVLIAVIFTFIVRIITVDGRSMMPTYHNGDRVLVSGQAGKLAQGDIVIIVHTLEEPIIKRVIATERWTSIANFAKSRSMESLWMKQNMESNLVLRKCRIIQDRCWSFLRQFRKAAFL